MIYSACVMIFCCCECMHGYASHAPVISEYCCDEAGRGVIIREYSSHSLLCTCGRREEGQVQFSFYIHEQLACSLNKLLLLPSCIILLCHYRSIRIKKIAILSVQYCWCFLVYQW